MTNRALLLAVALLLCLFLPSQNLLAQSLVGIGGAEYYWNNDPGEGLATALQPADGNFDQAVETAIAQTAPALAPGTHAFYVRFKSANGIWGPAFKALLTVESNAALAAPQVTQAEYFWNNDPGQGNGTALLAFDGNFNSALETALGNLPSGSLALGANSLGIRVKDAAAWGPVFTTMVEVEAPVTVAAPQITAAECFFDTDPGEGNGTTVLAMDGNFDRAVETLLANLPTNTLSTGSHIFSIRVRSAQGNSWGPAFQVQVYVEPNTAPIAPQLVQGELFWNTDPGAGNGTAFLAFDGNYDRAIETALGNISHPGAGIHLLNIRFKDASGWGTVWQHAVAVEADVVPDLPQLVQAEYFWNTDPGAGNATPLAALDGSFDRALETAVTASLNTSTLSEGAHTFYVRFKGKDNSWGPVFGQAIRFNLVLGSILPPVHISPANGSNNLNQSLSLLWRSVAGAANYELQYSTDASFNTGVTSQILGDTTIALSSLPYGSTWYWRLRSRTATEVGAWSTAWSFSVRPAPAFVQVPVLVSPANGMTANTEVVLDWQSLSGIDGYEIEWDTAAAFNSAVKGKATRSALTTSEQYVRDLFFIKTYHWRVRAFRGLDTSAWSSVWTFNTVGAPVLAWPADLTTGLFVGTLLDWGSSPGVRGYVVEADTSPNFNSPVIQRANRAYVNGSANNGDTEWQTSNLLFGKLYYWRVRAWNLSDSSAWSGSRRFITRPDISLNWPGQGATGVPVAVAVDWLAHVGVSQYQVQIDTSASFNSPQLQVAVKGYINSSSSNGDSEHFFTGLRYNTGYYWRVRAWNGIDTSQWSTVRNFTTVGELTLLSPSNGANVHTGTLLDWAAMVGTSQYHWQVDTSASFSSPALKEGRNSYINNSSSNGDTEAWVEDLYFGQRYFWRVRSLNAQDSSQWVTRTFNTIDYVNPLSPNGGNAYTGLLLDWSSHPGVDRYEWQTDTSASFDSPLLKQGQRTYVNTSSSNGDTEVWVTDHLFNQKYFWRVRAINAVDTSQWQGYTFTTVPGVTLFSPSNGQQSTGTNVTLDWSSHHGVQRYELQVDITNLFNSGSLLSVSRDYLNTSSSNSDTQWSLSGLQPNTIYFWRVRAINALDTSGWTERWFNTGSGPLALPNTPLLISPADFLVNQPIRPVLDWQGVANATSYQIQLSEREDFNSPITLNTADTNSQIQAGPLDYYTFYFWRVRAVNGSLASSWSTAWRFRTVPSIVNQKVTLRAPANGANVSPAAISLQWNGLLGATSYDYQLATDAAFTNVVAGASVLTTSDVVTLSASTTYFWRVRGSDGVNNSQWSDVWTLNTLQALPPASAPNLVSPADASTNLSTSPTLVWNRVTGANSYVVAWSTDASFTMVNSQTLADTSLQLSGLANNTTWYWRVFAANSYGTSPTSATWSFTTVALPQPPAAPVLLAPANGALDQPLSLQLLWNSSLAATSYTVQWSTNSAFTSASSQTLADTSLNLGPLSPGTTYYWRVLASNAVGDGAYSNAFSFTTLIPQPPAVPMLASPADASSNLPLVVQLNWHPVTDLTGYEVQISSSPTFPSATSITRADTFWTTPTLAYSTTYYWRVRAVNNVGPSAWSTVWSFTTMPAPPVPVVPTLVSPADQSTGLPTAAVSLIWRTSPTATGYELQWATTPAFTFPQSRTLADTTFTLNSLGAGVTYYWRVAAVNAQGPSSYSAAWQFTTDPGPQPPAVPLHVSPADLSVNMPTTVVVKWRTAARAVSYELQWATNAAFTSPSSVQLGDTTHTLNSLTPGLTYFWRVRAVNGVGVSARSTAWQFTVEPVIPEVPQLVSPANNASNLAINGLVLNWRKALRATSYELQYDVVPGFASPVSRTLTDTLFNLPTLNYSTSYYWRVRAINPQGSSAFSSAWVFTTTAPTTPPLAVQLLSPADNSVNQPTLITLRWSSAATASSYRLEYATDAAFVSPTVRTLGDTFATLTLSLGTTYFWRVQASNVVGGSAYSTVWQFSTSSQPTPPATVVLVSPANNATGQALATTLRWRRADLAQLYEVQWSTTASFASYSASNAVTDTSLLVNLLPGTTYYWRVRAYNSASFGSFSAPRQFSTIAPTTAPAAPVLVAPANFAFNQSASVWLSWRRSAQATTYEVQYSQDNLFLFGNTSLTVSDTLALAEPLSAGATYFWRVRARNSAGVSNWSSSRSFTVAFTPVVTVAPNLVAPQNGALNVSVTPRLYWRDVAAANSFELQWSTSPTFTGAILIPVNDTSFVTPTLQYNTLYYWRVRSVNNAGPSAWSTVWTFRTEISNSVQPTAQLKLNIYPNPASNWVKAEGLQQPAPFVLINSLGQTVLNGRAQPDQPIDLQGLPAGQYQLFLMTDPAQPGRASRHALIIR